MSELKIVKTITKNGTQYSLAWVFYLFTCILICLVCIIVLSCFVSNCCWLAVCIVVVILCVYVVPCVHCWFARLLARSHYSEGPATGHLDTGFSRFLCAYKQMLRWLPRFQVATTCFSCSPPDLNSVLTKFIFRMHVK